jgi:pyruvate/2-oxoglutarate dehydrogenase complex dihydrolipoamide acyltransferase (E2) component
VPARYRVRRASARSRVVKVVYGEDELEAVSRAAARAGLRPSSYVAAAALASAQGAASPSANSESRELLAELMHSRVLVRQYGTNLNQIAAALNSGVTDRRYG